VPPGVSSAWRQQQMPPPQHSTNHRHEACSAPAHRRLTLGFNHTVFFLAAAEVKAMGEVIQFRPLRSACELTEPNQTCAGGVRLTKVEDLFFDVLWRQLQEAGQEAPPELNLPSGTRVVHRAIVSKAYRISCADGLQVISENTIRSRWRRATCRLRKHEVIGFQEPYFWHTGKPALGKPATQLHRPGGAA
jgi:hypothetical protein